MYDSILTQPTGPMFVGPTLSSVSDPIWRSSTFHAVFSPTDDRLDRTKLCHFCDFVINLGCRPVGDQGLQFVIVNRKGQGQSHQIRDRQSNMATFDHGLKINTRDEVDQSQRFDPSGSFGDVHESINRISIRFAPFVFLIHRQALTFCQPHDQSWSKPKGVHRHDRMRFAQDRSLVQTRHFAKFHWGGTSFGIRV